MKGPYPLDSIRDRVNKGSIGIYVLTIKNRETRYVGRSAKNLRREIKYRAKRRWELRRIRYDHFKFEEARSAFEAYKRECTLWHRYGGPKMPDQCRHPARDKDTTWCCPVIGCPYHQAGR
jgi:hypothetical protein